MKAKYRGLLFGVLIAVISLASFHECLKIGFLSEDFFHITYTLNNGPFALVTGVRLMPIRWAIFRANYALFGTNPHSFHFANLFFHTANGIILFAIITLITKRNFLLAFAIATLFTIHPANTDNIFWISALADPLCAFFYLASILLFLLYLRTSNGIYYMICMISTILCLLSKEIGLSLPFVMLLLWYALDYFQRRDTGFGASTVLRKLKHYIVKLWPFFLLAFIYLIFALLRSGARETIGSTASIFRSLVYFFRAIVIVFLPPFVRQLSDFMGEHASVVKAVIAVSLITGAAVSVLLLRRKREVPLVGFGLGLLLFTFPLIPIFMAAQMLSHRHVYISLAVLLIFLAILLERYLSTRKKTLVFVLLSIILLLSFLSHREAANFLKADIIAKTFIADVNQIFPELNEGELLFFLTIPDSFKRMGIYYTGFDEALYYNYTKRFGGFYIDEAERSGRPQKIFWASTVEFQTNQIEDGIRYQYDRTKPEIEIAALVDGVYFHIPRGLSYTAQPQENGQYEYKLSTIEVLEVKSFSKVKARNRIKRFVVSLKNIGNYDKIYLLKYENGHVVLMDTIENQR